MLDNGRRDDQNVAIIKDSKNITGTERVMVKPVKIGNFKEHVLFKHVKKMNFPSLLIFGENQSFHQFKPINSFIICVFCPGTVFLPLELILNS